MTVEPENPQRILVIRLDGLGDFMLSIGAMQAIRRHHPDAHITLLTTWPFVDVAQRSGCFDDIWIDARLKFHQLRQWFAQARRLNAAKFTRVYDLQASERTALYYRLFIGKKKPEWVGAADIESGYPDLSFMHSDVSAFGLKKPYVLLVPGSDPRRPDKRWPALKYGALARKLMIQDYDVAVLGTNAEREVIARILKSCPQAHDLGGRTSFYDIVALGTGAAAAVGNDTGPLHILSLAGCPTLALFSAASDPALSAPVGDNVTVIQTDDLGDLSVEEVFGHLKLRGENVAA